MAREVFELGLKKGTLLVYIYLVHYKSLKHKNSLTCASISKVIGLSEKTVQTHLHTLVGKGFIQLTECAGHLACELSPIQDKVQKMGSCASRKSSWLSAKQEWVTGERFSAVFPLPNEVFRLGLKASDLLVYIYLQYQKGVRSGQCWPSYATIGAAVGMSRKIVQKHVCALVDKGLLTTENTSVFSNGLKVNGSLLYTLKPIRQVLKEREDELLADLKLVEAQRKWAQKFKPSEPVTRCYCQRHLKMSIFAGMECRF